MSESCSESDQFFSTRIPLTRLRPLIKLDPDVQITAQDAVFLIAKGSQGVYIKLVYFLRDCSHILMKSIVNVSEREDTRSMVFKNRSIRPDIKMLQKFKNQ